MRPPGVQDGAHGSAGVVATAVEGVSQGHGQGIFEGQGSGAVVQLSVRGSVADSRLVAPSTGRQ